MRVAGALQVFMGTSILLTISGIFSSDQAGLLALFYVCGAFQLACGIGTYFGRRCLVVGNFGGFFFC